LKFSSAPKGEFWKTHYRRIDIGLQANVGSSIFKRSIGSTELLNVEECDAREAEKN